MSYEDFWWREVDSNHRSETQQIYSLPPLATRELLHMEPVNELVRFRNSFEIYKHEEFEFFETVCGAGERTRTPDLLITNQLLYQLSYTSVW